MATTLLQASRKALLLICAACGVVCLASTCAWADDSRPIYSSSALLRASRPNRAGMIGSGLFDRGFTDAVGEQLELTTMDEMFSDDQKQLFSAQYRSYYYTRYLSGFRDRNESILDPDEDRHIAEQVTFYELAVTITDLLLHSPVGNDYQRFRETFSDYSDYVTLRVSRKGSGNWELGKASRRDNQLLEMKVSANVTRGVQPQVRIINNFLLKYDTVAQAPLIEYNLSF